MNSHVKMYYLLKECCGDLEVSPDLSVLLLAVSVLVMALSVLLLALSVLLSDL